MAGPLGRTLPYVGEIHSFLKVMHSLRADYGLVWRSPSGESLSFAETWFSQEGMASFWHVKDLSVIDAERSAIIRAWQLDQERALLEVTDGFDPAGRGLQVEPIGLPLEALLEEIVARLIEQLTTEGQQASPDVGHIPSTGQNVFRKRAEYWEIEYQDTVFYLRATKGLNYLSWLLRHPQREFPVIELVAAVEKNQPAPTAGIQAEADDLQHGDWGDADPIIDDEARKAYRDRLHEIGEEREHALAMGAAEKVVQLDEEVEGIESALRGTTALGGRSRKFGTPLEKARILSRKHIKAAIDKIGEHNPDLCTHLESSISTGQKCSYRPDPKAPPNWILS